MTLREDGDDQRSRTGNWVSYSFFFFYVGGSIDVRSSSLPVVPWAPNRQRGGNGAAT